MARRDRKTCVVCLHSDQMMAWCAVEVVEAGPGSHSGSGSATSGVTCNVVTSHCQTGAGARHPCEP